MFYGRHHDFLFGLLIIIVLSFIPVVGGEAAARWFPFKHHGNLRASQQPRFLKADNKENEKQWICHRTNDATNDGNHQFELIHISSSAVQAHMKHTGDYIVMVDETFNPETYQCTPDVGGSCVSNEDCSTLPEGANPVEVASYCVCSDENDINTCACEPICIQQGTLCYDGGVGDQVCRRCVDYCPRLSFQFNLQFRDDGLGLSLNQAKMDELGWTDAAVISEMKNKYPFLQLAGQECTITVNQLDDIIGSNIVGHAMVDTNNTSTNPAWFNRKYRVYSPEIRKYGRLYNVEATSCPEAGNFFQSFGQVTWVQKQIGLRSDGKPILQYVGAKPTFFEASLTSRFFVPAYDPTKNGMGFKFSVGQSVVTDVGSGSNYDPFIHPYYSPTNGGGPVGLDPWWLPYSAGVLMDNLDPSQIEKDGYYPDLLATSDKSWSQQDTTDVDIGRFTWTASFGNDPWDGEIFASQPQKVTLTADVESISFFNSGMVPCHFEEDDTCDKICYDCSDESCSDLTHECFRPHCVAAARSACVPTGDDGCISTRTKFRTEVYSAVDNQQIVLCGESDPIPEAFDIGSIGTSANHLNICCQQPPCILIGANLIIGGENVTVEGINFVGSESRNDGALIMSHGREGTGNYAIVNCEFHGYQNVAVEATYGRSLVILNSTFIDNKANSEGGALKIGSFDHVLIRNNTFLQNEGTVRAGAIYATLNQVLELNDNSFHDNAAPCRGGAGRLSLTPFGKIILEGNAGDNNEATTDAATSQCWDCDDFAIDSGVGHQPNGCFDLNGLYEDPGYPPI